MQTVTGTDIIAAANYLKAGELVAIPTETVYGLAGNALDENAVIKIFTTKGRPRFNPLILHVASWTAAERYVKNIPTKAYSLAAAFMPGPVSFLLPKNDLVPDIVTAGSDKVAVRVPGHPLTQQLLQLLPFPLAAPSANPFGYISPTTAAHVRENLGGKIPYILDGGPARVGVESTIIGFDEAGQPLLYRSGGIGTEAIEEVLGEKILKAGTAAAHQPETSGRLKSHYAPHTPLYLGHITAMTQLWAGKKIALISFKDEYAHLPAAKHFVLSPAGNLNEAASKLFAVLREADSSGYDVILTEKFPNHGIGRAINDRLEKAQALHKD
ncbi:MAG TPA: L-threonylcarbamoyladenylate synthase [Ferruginibacter sp.]|nr:L-threonylcarbamoyladenylate synthase [Ferruginibacter sp.]HMP21160.1 L-threonylcarbamoyladenylate synthase [Ferruginibacter sp.]